MSLKTVSDALALLVAAGRWLRGVLFKAEKIAATKHTEETKGDTSKEEDLFRRGGQ